METTVLEKTIEVVDKYDGIVLSYLIHIGFAILIFIVGRFIASFLSRQLRKILLAKEVEPTVVKFSSSLARYTVMAFTFVAVLGQLGVQTTSIVAIIGATGLAIGLALQGSLSNFAAGVLLIIFRPFKVGELVVITGIQGNVDAVQIFSTTLLTPTGEFVVIPNNQVLSTNVVNYSRQPTRRIDLTINIDYNADIKRVYQVLKESVDQTSKILTSKDITIRLDELAASSINYIVLVWVNNDDYGEVKTQLLEKIRNNLATNNINIPYPTMDVNVHKQ